MTYDEFKILYNTMIGFYPHFVKNNKAIFEAWYQLLKTLDYKAASSGLARWVVNNKYPPTVSDIVSFSMPNHIDAESAWTMIIRNARKNEIYDSYTGEHKYPCLGDKLIDQALIKTINENAYDIIGRTVSGAFEGSYSDKEYLKQIKAEFSLIYNNMLEDKRLKLFKIKATPPIMQLEKNNEKAINDLEYEIDKPRRDAIALKEKEASENRKFWRKVIKACLIAIIGEEETEAYIKQHPDDYQEEENYLKVFPEKYKNGMFGFAYDDCEKMLGEYEKLKSKVEFIDLLKDKLDSSEYVWEVPNPNI